MSVAFNGQNIKYWIKLAICLIVPFLILLLPVNELFTPLIRKYLAVTMFGILMFVFEIAPGPVVAFTLAISYAVFSVAPLDTVLASWSHPIVYQCIAILLLLEGVNATPLLKRIAAHLVIRMGGTYRGVLFGITIASLVCTLLIPSVTTVFLIIGLCYGLCQSLGLKPGSAAAAGIMLLSANGVMFALNFLYSPQSIGAVAAMVSTTVPGYSIDLFTIIKENIVWIPFLFLVPLLISVIFKPDVPINGADYFRDQLQEIGKMSGKEKRCIVILVVMILYLFTAKWHKLDMAYGFAVAAALMYFPAINIASMTDFKRADVGFPVLVASCMTIGNVGTFVGASALIGQILLPILENSSSGLLFVIVSWSAGILSNLLMTPMALYTLLGPVLGPIADSLGYSANIVSYILWHAGNVVFFPYENNTLLMMYGFGMMTMTQFIRGSVALLIADLVWLCLIAYPYWGLIGLF